MLKECTQYDKATGRLLGTGFIDTNIEPLEGVGRLSGRYDLDTMYYYAYEGTVIPRTDSGAVMDQGTIALGGSVTISNLPIPCEVEVSTGSVQVDDGILIITPASVGYYTVGLNHPHHKRMTFSFEVTE